MERPVEKPRTAPRSGQRLGSSRTAQPAGRSAPLSALSNSAIARLARRHPRRPVLARAFLHPDVLPNYQSAAQAWALASQDAARFDANMDDYSRRSGLTAANNPVLGQLGANALIKSNRAAGTMAGEAAEVSQWAVGAHSITGPGGNAGVDLREYQPHSGSAPARLDKEVKTARTFATFKTGIADALDGNAAHVTVYYSGNPADLAAVANPGIAFVAGGVAYTTHPYADVGAGAGPSARVEAFNQADRSPITRFQIRK